MSTNSISKRSLSVNPHNPIYKRLRIINLPFASKDESSKTRKTTPFMNCNPSMLKHWSSKSNHMFGTQHLKKFLNVQGICQSCRAKKKTSQKQAKYYVVCVGELENPILNIKVN